MKSYFLPFTTITTGTWEIRAESLEAARAIVALGWPYEHSDYEEITDENTSWDIDQIFTTADKDAVLKDYTIEASQRRYLSVTVKAASYADAEQIADELLTDDFMLDNTDFSIDNIYSKIEED